MANSYEEQKVDLIFKVCSFLEKLNIAKKIYYNVQADVNTMGVFRFIIKIDNDGTFTKLVERAYDEKYLTNSDTVDEVTLQKLQDVCYPLFNYLAESIMVELQNQGVTVSSSFYFEYFHSTNFLIKRYVSLDNSRVGDEEYIEGINLNL